MEGPAAVLASPRTGCVRPLPPPGLAGSGSTGRRTQLLPLSSCELPGDGAGLDALAPRRKRQCLCAGYWASAPDVGGRLAALLGRHLAVLVGVEQVERGQCPAL